MKLPVVDTSPGHGAVLPPTGTGGLAAHRLAEAHGRDHMFLISLRSVTVLLGTQMSA